MKNFQYLGLRFFILLGGVVTAAWSLRTANYWLLLLSFLAIGFGIGIDRNLTGMIAYKNYLPHTSMQDLETRKMTIRVSSIDSGPDDLFGQTPFEANILWRIPGSDRPDYWLAELTKPLHWDHDGAQQVITHIVIATRFAEQLERGMKDRGFGIAYVTDRSLLTDKKLIFSKAAYVAIGFLDDISTKD